ncbi:MAG TPA: sialate O-acetylesterase [Planctomycetota bacterium]|jgi:sialate O-acetylesterase
MLHFHPRSFAAALLLLCGIAAAADAPLKPALLFQDNMVLQQGTKVPVWGTAAPSEQITVRFAGQTVSATAAQDGRWQADLQPLKVSLEPAELTIASAKSTIAINNVLVGEVWLCSGQSNMELRVKDALNADQEKAQANHPTIRMLTVGPNRWHICSPETVADFSAVGYFFAREISARLKVPVGIINSSRGGTPIQPWMSPASAKTVPCLKAYWDDVAAQVAQCKADPKAWEQRCKDAAAQIETARDQWEQNTLAADPGLKDRWFDPATDTKNWRTIELPMPDHNAGLNDVGTVWLRRQVTIPKPWVGKAIELSLAPIDEIDFTYVNGKEIGRTWRDVKDFWRIPRCYKVPAEQNTAERVTIAVRIYNVFGLMGMLGKPEQMSLKRADDPQAPPISLAGTWQIRTGIELDLSTQPKVTLLSNPTADGDFGVLYKLCIAPLVPYAIKGALWYQGESNAHEPELYAQLFPAMIRGWRDAWGQGDFSFYYVTLAGHQGRQRLPIERNNSWADLRDAQRSALALPHTGEAVATDIGDAPDIHPRNKQDVGKRLALLALAKDYAQDVKFSGPVLKKMDIRGEQAVLTFDHAEGMRFVEWSPTMPVGVVPAVVAPASLPAVKDPIHAGVVPASVPAGRDAGSNTCFAIAGEDKVFHAGTAVVRDQTVIVTAADGQVKTPVAVRFDWGFHPTGFLYNAANLPAAPFRTDNWNARDVLACDLKSHP